jgi:hypothetical protein
VRAALMALKRRVTTKPTYRSVLRRPDGKRVRETVKKPRTRIDL